jgi:hypothetical protein
MLCFQVRIAPPLYRSKPTWFSLGYKEIWSEHIRRFRALPRNVTILPEFDGLKLSNDGAHLTAKATVDFLTQLMDCNAEDPPEPSDAVSRDERLSNLENETTATRQLYLDLSEQLRSYMETASLVSCRHAEMIDGQVNRSNENLLEIRGKLWSRRVFSCTAVFQLNSLIHFSLLVPPSCFFFSVNSCAYKFYQLKAIVSATTFSNNS